MKLEKKFRLLGKWGFRCMLLVPRLGGYLSRTYPRTNVIRKGMAASIRYCYATWLHHLVHARKRGLNDIPEVVVELGPGSSLGVGLAALICGSSKYYALDIVEHAQSDGNLRIFDELVDLFQRRERIPDGNEFPRLKGWLDTFDFPAHVLDETRLHKALEPKRLERIRESIKSPPPPRERGRLPTLFLGPTPT